MPYKDIEKRKEYCKEWRRKKIEKDPHYKEEMVILSRDFYRNNKEKIKKRFHKRGNDLKLEIFALLGNKCSSPNCAVVGGMKDLRALQIDHINGGGAKEWRIMHSPETYYKHILGQLKIGSKDYQLLCANCNWIKRVENKELFRKS